ncbi:MAG: [citrate (pro-3S)-lyase] ligase [Clostridiales bacterium]|nr:[citrate (pro-3S)-lyase] ligase [Clostridiales bacterium]
MREYAIREIPASDGAGQTALRTLLAAEGLELDRHVDYSCGLFDACDRLLATGSAYRNTLRCLAVDSAHRGEGLLGALVTHLTEVALSKGHAHLFLYAKPEAAPYFSDLGFFEIARVEGELVFMENRAGAFRRYCEGLAGGGGGGAAVVMNANPFTLGHLHLVERAARENSRVELFVVSEERSLVPFRDRFEMVKRGTAALPNVRVHPTGSYMVSSATFPSYFLKDELRIMRAHARLDCGIFLKIARAAGISRRYVGEEPFSQITAVYNEAMLEILPAGGIELIVVPRLEKAGVAVSASRVRALIHAGDFAAAGALLPAASREYLLSETGKPILEAIRLAEHVVHE